MHKDLFADYRRLIAKVDDFSARIIRAHRPHFACRLGCTECCPPDLHLLPVEFSFMSERFASLPKGVQRAIRQNGASGMHDRSCSLLHEGVCLMYEHRPVICRTHGLPLLILEDGQEHRDCCPKNFVGYPLVRLPRKDLVDLDTLNAMLVVVNIVFASHMRLEPGVRLPLFRIAYGPSEPVR
jgi:hypothetical protein